MEPCSNGQTELSRLMVTNSSNQMISGCLILLAGSGFNTEEDHLNIKIIDSSVCYNATTLLICGNMVLDINILKMHPKAVPNLKKGKIIVLANETSFRLLFTTRIK